MSRTFRHMKSSKYRLDDLTNYHYDENWNKIKIDHDSKLFKKIKARFHAKSDSIMVWHGPMWWLRLVSQKPYRMRAKQQLHRYKENPEHEVMIESKPHRDYWW